MRYITPGAPPPPPLPQATNHYIHPGSPHPDGAPNEPPTPQPVPSGEPPHTTLRDAWRTHHGSAWRRADDLHPDVRRMIDERDRTSAIRQKLRQLARTPHGSLRFETKATGNAAKPVTLYRLSEVADG